MGIQLLIFRPDILTEELAFTEVEQMARVALHHRTLR